MTKKVVVWESEFNNYLIYPEEVKEAVAVFENVLLIENVDVSKAEELEKQLKDYITEKEKEGEDFYYTEGEMQEFLQNIGYETAEVSWSDNYEEKREVLIFDETNKCFGNLNDWEEVKTYEWWNGHNMVTVELNEITTETIVEITESRVCLDEYNGHDWVTGGTGEHEYVHKIVRLDEKVVDDMYFIWQATQWQGSHDAGKIVTIEELKEHLEQLDRNVEEYMYEIGKLTGE